jgi:hypothetical protein
VQCFHQSIDRNEPGLFFSQDDTACDSFSAWTLKNVVKNQIDSLVVAATSAWRLKVCAGYRTFRRAGGSERVTGVRHVNDCTGKFFRDRVLYLISQTGNFSPGVPKIFYTVLFVVREDHESSGFHQGNFYHR